uniref:Uncharacterized protein n=1 Tax=Myoviridae sp. ctijX18 TaxID=2825154 RepID=A0A8S5USU8_9CAUD|nr:MAG TPA: hypothetical protein [Myoviridae sp. ctijX18]DAQ61188.1 MAG TPA: hypothetical protein [Caudoviricetes sp.]
MSLLDLDSTKKEVSQEWGLGYMNDVKDAIEKEARNSSVTMTVDKKTREELNREMDEKLAAQEAEADRKRENRNQAVRDIADGMVDLAKVTGRGVKEIARIAYNLALGEDKAKDTSSKEQQHTQDAD